jgi:hypothetical protein
MSIGFIYWLLMILWLIFGLWAYWPRAGATAPPWPFVGGSGFMFVLLFLLGWKVFGWPING